MRIVLLDTLKKKGISQYKLAKLSNLSMPTINNLCNEKVSRIDFETLDKICTALNCEVGDILQYDQNFIHTSKKSKSTVSNLSFYDLLDIQKDEEDT